MDRELAALRAWHAYRWAFAAFAGIAIAVAVAIPTDIIPNPFFARSMSVTWWSYPVLVVTGILGGLLAGTYLRDAANPIVEDRKVQRTSKLGMVGAGITVFAVGCPVCNKLVVIALGATGAVTWFAPFQPVIAMLSVILMAVAVRARLKNQDTCRLQRV